MSRLEVISTINPKRWPVGRVELQHKIEGSVVDVATGAGSVDAIFNALAQLFRLEARVQALSAQYEPMSEDERCYLEHLSKMMVWRANHVDEAESLGTFK